MKLENRTILVTGGSSGIGLELAAQLLARGNVVIVTGRNVEALERARAAHPGLHVIVSDVSDPAQVRTLYETVARDFPALSVLVNNAGVMRKINLHRASDDLGALCREIDVNFAGTVRMCAQFLPLLRARPE